MRYRTTAAVCSAVLSSAVVMSTASGTAAASARTGTQTETQTETQTAMKARTQTGTKAEAKAAAKCYRHTTKIKLTARKGPGTSYKEVGNISKGVSVCVNEIRNGGKYKECGGDNRWAKLSKPFGGRWVAAVCLRWAE